MHFCIRIIKLTYLIKRTLSNKTPHSSERKTPSQKHTNHEKKRRAKKKKHPGKKKKLKTQLPMNITFFFFAKTQS